MDHVISDGDLEAMRRLRVFTWPDGSDRLRRGDTVQFLPDVRVEKYVGLFDGSTFCSVGAFTYMWSRVNPLDMDLKIGRYCSIAGNVTVFPGNHPLHFVSTSPFTGDDQLAICRAALDDFGHVDFVHRYVDERLLAAPVIGNDVWIGQDATLARGITLGHGCAVGTGSVVTRSVPPYAVVAGNPARIIRMRFPEPLIEALLSSEWWRFAFPEFGAMRFDQPERFLGELGERVAAGTITPFKSSIPIRDIFSERSPAAPEERARDERRKRSGLIRKARAYLKRRPG